MTGLVLLLGVGMVQGGIEVAHIDRRGTHEARVVVVTLVLGRDSVGLHRKHVENVSRKVSLFDVCFDLWTVAELVSGILLKLFGIPLLGDLKAIEE